LVAMVFLQEQLEPFPCSTAAREPDGTTTCVGLQ
jgi:hypothetical protein